ncbi:helix-turn-helix transcriptional regulator [Kitasatospora aureofaciens]|uniref:helix-turn-helix transcriptional regulator n=1 Tax=Kitasatospora aureofaciens TaxID=1894 RepID=UPI00068E0395|nr:LuxR family transcriptional regulator [Kitasatospora aureofaciens]
MKTTEQQTERLTEHRADARAELRVERRAQLHALHEVFDRTTAGEGSAAVVTGPVGCGKTDVLHALCRHAARAGALVLTATGVRAERDLGFGVLDRLLDDPELPHDTAGHVRALLSTVEREPGAPAGRPAAPTAGAGCGEQPMPAARARELRALCTALREAARHRPLVIAVDDLQHADRPSVAALMYLRRRLRTARVLMVFTDGGADAPDGVGPHAELAGDPDCRTVRVAPLTRRGVTELLAARLDPRTAEWLAAECHALTGGNPLLVHAFADDRRTAGDHEGDTPVGSSFSAALGTCLLRCDTGAADAARALAVLADLAPISLVARMLGTGVEAAARALAALTEAGLLDEGRFRHPAAHAAVLAGCEDADRRAHHLRAARLLHEDGAPGAAVARQLVAAQEAPGPWAVTVLREAAEQESVADRERFGADCLELAVRACGDPRERAALTALLVRDRWRTSPSVAARHLGALEAHARDGLLSARDSATLTLGQLWLGRAADTVPRAAPEPTRTGFADTGRYRADVRGARRLLYWDTDTTADTGSEGPEPSAEEVTADAELTLQCTRIGDTALESAMAALYALLHVDQPGQAAHWCDTLIAEATARRETTWRAVLTGIRAETAVRQGALADAERHARTALAVLPPEDWGVAIGIPLAARLVACTFTGRPEDAQGVLTQRVPQEMFRTRFGGQYLYARGQHYLAAGRLRAALEDFLRCGELMRARGVDRPALIAWRGGAATACLGLGLRERAGELIGEQMELSAPEHLRVRGSSLRTIAALNEARRRPALLWEAVTLLQEAGDRLELVGALADLSSAHHELGDYNRARMVAGRAVRLAQDCGAPSLCERLLPYPVVLDPAPPADTGPADARTDAIATLSDAERRVAALAAVGYSNREIGRELFITVSTVEQHLTRVYRKLRISRRADLPAELPLGPPGAA